tara:strand:+ start:123 stop:314 length:192 start_codon:yes stop_codon:yes gene_type:complete
MRNKNIVPIGQAYQPIPNSKPVIKQRTQNISIPTKKKTAFTMEGSFLESGRSRLPFEFPNPPG